MTTRCSYEGCTVDTTGLCVLGHDLSECPNWQSGEAGDDASENASGRDDENRGRDANIDDLAPSEIAAPVLEAPVSTSSPLPTFRQLGYSDLERIASDRGIRLVGILGPPEAGKTAVLVSLYLLLSGRRLERFKFRNSESIFALDELARGAREWDGNGEKLETITDHTHLDDPRRPGFLHFRLLAEKIRKPIDFIFPDLPGEWTNDLINNGDHDRLSFLKVAHALWVFVDGSALIDPVRRQSAVDRTNKILARIRKFVDPAGDKPVIVVITRRDEIEEVPQDQLDLIQKEADLRGLLIQFIPVACISETAGIPTGFGIEDLLDASIVVPDEDFTLPTSIVSDAAQTRQMLKYRSLS